MNSFLDDAYALLLKGNVYDGMDMLDRELKTCRNKNSFNEWRNYVSSYVLSHPVKNLIHLCPFTKHSFYKPRGYAGDAELIDFIYGEGHAKNVQLEGIALKIAHHSCNTAAPRAVRYRRELLAQRIEESVNNEENPFILSIAAGHLREIELSPSALNGKVGRFYALDQDKDSVALMQREYGCYNVSASVGSVRQLLSGKIKFSGLSLVYAAGLFDYLVDKVAQRLVEVMFSFLKPGGRMLVANFLPNIPDVGYMESFMDWFLIFRSRDELLKLFETLPKDKVADLIVSFDPDENIVFVEAIKK